MVSQKESTEKQGAEAFQVWLFFWRGGVVGCFLGLCKLACLVIIDWLFSICLCSMLFQRVRVFVEQLSQISESFDCLSPSIFGPPICISGKDPADQLTCFLFSITCLVFVFQFQEVSFFGTAAMVLFLRKEQNS